MKKSFGIYSIIWAICLAIFNLVVFVTPNEIGGVSKFSGSFWVGYIFITVAFVCQLACAFAAFRAKSAKQLLYAIPIIYISYIGLIIMLIAGSVCMVIPTLPKWVGIIVCSVILAINAISVIKASFAADTVNKIDEKLDAKLSFIKKLTVDAQSLATVANGELSKTVNRVYEAIRYSDPTSNEVLCELDGQIAREFNVFADAVRDNDAALADATATSLIEMLARRNESCKLLK